MVRDNMMSGRGTIGFGGKPSLITYPARETHMTIY
jgi:hypothetical protein